VNNLPNARWSMIQDALGCARDELSYTDYSLFAKRAIGPGMAYYDRMRILDELIEANFVVDFGRHLAINESPELDKIEPALASGLSEAWALENFFPVAFRKFQDNSEFLTEVGLRGEEYVISILEASLSADRIKLIKHVSQYNDSAGYDIFAPSISGNNQGYLLEVKTSVRNSDLMTMFISRNEVDVALKNKNWRLVGVEINDGIPRLLGYLHSADFVNLLPIETSKQVHWTNLRMQFAKDTFLRGLP